MKRSPLRKIGKIGKANIEARKIIGRICGENNIISCELRFNGCMGNFGFAPAHRHERLFYKGDVSRLSDMNEWLMSCVWCHQILDDRSKTKKDEVEKIFNKLRQ